MTADIRPTLEEVPVSAIAVPAAGSPLILPTAFGEEMSVIIDTRGGGANRMHTLNTAGWFTVVGGHRDRWPPT